MHVAIATQIKEKTTRFLLGEESGAEGTHTNPLNFTGDIHVHTYFITQ